MASSSSMMSTFPREAGARSADASGMNWFAGKRQFDRERGALARFAFYAHRTGVFPHDAVTDGQAQTRCRDDFPWW